ncbi:hypothetical protein [uncultured Jatrophihabitans sp.]|uniref:hypothetical protein n=1 Tax=uncultured Jatrophihabitans sp. TaxID=1610747 RepID=UPI0035CB51EE
MDPEPEDEYFLGGANDDDDDADTSSRRAGLIGLAVVLVVVAAAITLTSLLVDTSSASRGPRTAARAWGTALVHGDTAARRRLECAVGSRSSAVVRLALVGATGVSTGAADQLDKNRWSVPLEIERSDSSLQDSVDVTVVREYGRYVVC